MPYLKGLDGLRAVAIIAVLIFHVSPSALRGGFTGVDVFFVLSGFLITTLLLHELRGGVLSLREFYLRRVQRLLPNVVATVLAVLALWSLFLPPSTARTTGSHGLWTLFSASNIYIWKNLGGYWGDSAESAPLTHTWSLGIEEQFYLLFPCLLLLLTRWNPHRLVVWLWLGALVSFSVCSYGSDHHPVVTFYLLPTRVWELLVGAILAAHRTPFPHVGNSWVKSLSARSLARMGWIGLGLILAGFLWIEETTSFPGWVCLVPTLGTALLLLSLVDGETLLSLWFSNPAMVQIGKISYSLYLWHWPIITFGKIQAGLHGFSTLFGAAVGAAGGVVLSWMAYRWIEQPLRDRGPGRPKRLAVIGGGFVSVTLIAAYVAALPRVADPRGLFDRLTYHGKLFDAAGAIDGDFAQVTRFYDVSVPPMEGGLKESWREGGIVHLFGGEQPKVVVLGSSHALMYSQMVDNLCRQQGISVAFLGVGGGVPAFFDGTPNLRFPTPAKAREFDETRRRFLSVWRPEAVFVVDRWDSRAETADDFEPKLRSFLQEVCPLARWVYFVAQVPVLQGGDEVNMREMVTFKSGGTAGLPLLFPDLKDELRKKVALRAETLTREFSNFRVLRVDLPFYHADGSVRYASGRHFFYTDDDHLTDAGSEVVREMFDRALLDAGISGRWVP